MKAGRSYRVSSRFALAIVILAVGCGKEADDADRNIGGRTSGGSAVAPRTLTKPMDRYEWNLQTLVVPYLKRGHHDPAWDEPATNALVKFAASRSSRDWDDTSRSLLVSYCREAVLKGCTDPVILYLHTRDVVGYQAGTTDQDMAAGYRKAAGLVATYPCAPVRQFYLALRTSQALRSSATNSVNNQEYYKYLRMAMTQLFQTIKNPEVPPAEVYDVCREILAAIGRSPLAAEFYRDLEPALLRNWPNEAFVFIIKGRFHLEEAWSARGGGYAKNVSKDGWKLFAEHNEQAADALERAWKIDPKNPEIPYEMLRVELGQGKGRDRMELWFNRAMELNSNYVAACQRKLFYLEPKWYGSPEEMLAFARECATSPKWAGEVLLLPLDAHRALAAFAKSNGDTNYWKRPSVWPEIKSALDRYLERYPEQAGWRHNYAWYAYQCEQWQEFNRQLPLFAYGTNHQYFGGKEAFDRMVENARERERK